MRLLPWLIAATLLVLNSIQQDHVVKYKVERDQARAKFQEGAKTFWDSQAEVGAVTSAHRTRHLEMAVKIKQQKLIIDAYEAELRHYRREGTGSIPDAAVP